MERVGDLDHAGALVVAVDLVLADRRLDLVEVAAAELFEDLDLVGPPRHPVADPVGEAGVHEAAVAAARRRTALVGVDQHDVARRVALLGDDRRPEPGVAAADDAQVARLGAHQGGVGLGFVDVLVPVRILVGVGDGVEVALIDRGRDRWTLLSPGCSPGLVVAGVYVPRAWTSGSRGAAPPSQPPRAGSVWRPRQGARQRGCAWWRSAAAIRGPCQTPRSRDRPRRSRRSSPMSATPMVRRVRGRRHRGAGRRSTSSSRNAGGPPAGNFADDAGRCLSAGARPQPDLGRGDVQGGRAGDAGASGGGGWWRSPRCRCVSRWRS